MTKLDADQMLTAAERLTGLSDWGGDAFFEPEFRQILAVLCQSLNDEADLTEKGLAAARLRIEGALEARLQFVEDRRRHPEIDNVQIVAPLIITGLPRSGTTFLHGLLAQDGRYTVPRAFEMIFPVSESDPERDAQRLARTREIFDRLGLLDPEVNDLHPYGPGEPEEDHMMQEILLLGDQFPAFWRLPSYMRLRAELPPDIVWKVHRQVLQTLQTQSGAERVLLKHPGHIFDIAGLVKAYPDVRIIQTHRDPAKVVPSVVALVGAVRRAGSRSEPDAAKIARGNVQAFKQGLDEVIDLRQDPRKDAHFVDVQFRDLIGDPMGTVASIYDAFGMVLTPDARGAMQSWLDGPKSKAAKVKYDLEDFGIDRQDINNTFERYRNRFQIPLEPA